VTRLTATDRLRRLLAVIPWVSGRGEVALTEIAERFDYPIEQLRRDLSEVVQFVGVHPYTPDMLIEVVLDDENDRVRFELADYFTSPLRLTPDEGLSLVSAGLGLLGSRAGQDTALERALTKVAERFDLRLGEQLEVSLGGADPRVVETAIRAVDEHRCVHLLYYSLHRGASTDRTVEPHHVFSRDGEWYMRGHCRLVGETRTFRLDRAIAIDILDETFPETTRVEATTFAPDEDDIRVTLDLLPDAAWVADAYPVESAKKIAKGRTRVTLAVSSLRWLERLLIQLGPAAAVVKSVPDLPPALRSDAAQRVLARYRG
jgi:proteasome accessory factor C